ncbi:hypothetical protein STRATTON_243 [Erwinia phage vB_EamM_Stratton]|uniref:Uncharacterized protein n=1 Tax=Erwinia phage vB_EamM_Stratton TaxID=1883378 RepID=A0A1B2IHD8_9CAUD|nr:hypothetical protein STRATTON_243 [Erwinia phage vB_EamM_Stratton]
MSEEVKYQAFDGNVDDEDSLLRETQQLRIRLANDMAAEPKVHTDLKAVDRIDRLLNSVDKQIMSKRKIKAAEKGAEATQDVANALNGFLMQRAGVGIKRHDAPPSENTGYQPPLPQIDDVEMNPGQLAPVGDAIDVGNIMASAYSRAKQTSEDAED